MPRVGLRKQAVQAGHRLPGGQRVVFTETRVAADGGVVGKRGHRAGTRGAVGRLAEAIQPITGNFGVGVEQHHIAPPCQPHADVDRAHEAQVACVGEHADAGLPVGQFAQPGAHFGLRTGVVDQRQVPGRAALGGQHAGHAALQHVEPAVDGQHDLDAGFAPLRQAALQCQVVGRQRPAAVHFQHPGPAAGQRAGWQRQIDLRIVTLQMAQQVVGARLSFGQVDLVPSARCQGLPAIARGAPLPRHLIVGASQRQRMQVQQARAVGRVQAQHGIGRQTGCQRKTQGLPVLADAAQYTHRLHRVGLRRKGVQRGHEHRNAHRRVRWWHRRAQGL